MSRFEYLVRDLTQTSIASRTARYLKLNPTTRLTDTMAPDHKACLSTSRRPDYLMVACYSIVYLEVGWLILMLLRSYSRD